MDPLRLLSQLGRVEPVDEVVLDAALGKLADAVGQDRRPASASLRPRLLSAIGMAVALTVAVAVVAWFGRSAPVTRSGALPKADGSSRPTSPGSPAIAAILTAFGASGNDVLVVTKVVSGEGTCCRSIIRLSPAAPSPGATVRSRIQNFTISGSRLADTALAYTAPATAAAARAGCGGIFGRPRVATIPASGLPGTLTMVNYTSHVWSKGQVRVVEGTVPTASALRACLKDGRWLIQGRSVRGRSGLIEFATTDGSGRLWVSASTFLPVRLVESTPRTPYPPVIISFVFKFLPPTAANEAMLTVPIPAGFSEIPEPQR